MTGRGRKLGVIMQEQDAGPKNGGSHHAAVE